MAFFLWPFLWPLQPVENLPADMCSHVLTAVVDGMNAARPPIVQIAASYAFFYSLDFVGWVCCAVVVTRRDANRVEPSSRTYYEP